jgi:hypothetical protein
MNYWKQHLRPESFLDFFCKKFVFFKIICHTFAVGVKKRNGFLLLNSIKLIIINHLGKRP